MLSLQREIERIIKHVDDYDCFIKDNQFLRTYELSGNTLSVTKSEDFITVTASDVLFEFKRLPYNPSWYPIQVVKDSEVISIVIEYENSRAHSVRNWSRFQDIAKEISNMITGMDVEVLNQSNASTDEKAQFKQMSFW